MAVAARVHIKRGSPVVDRLRTDREVVVGSLGPATVANQSAKASPRTREPRAPGGGVSGPAILSGIPNLRYWGLESHWVCARR